MSAVHSLWVEGEQIPDEHLKDIYHHPPGIATTYLRSHLVIGSRGVGKTTFFRFQKLSHQGIAIHLSLNTEFSSLTKQVGLGPLSFDCPPGLEPLLIGKANSLLALSLFDRLLSKGVKGPIDLLAECLPKEHQQKLNSTTDRVDQSLKREVASAPLSTFEGIADLRPLPELVSALGELSRHRDGPLLLLLDRADMVLSPSLIPVFELLDQSSNYVALVAMRPGHLGESVLKLTNSLVPGDHYGIVHFGTHPRSSSWIEFVKAAVSAQLIGTNGDVLDEKNHHVIVLSRDSIRTALEVLGRCASVPINERDNETSSALEDLRENLLTAAQSTLQKYHPEFRQFVNDCRSEAIGKGDYIPGPVVVNVQPAISDNLFESSSRLTRFVELGLRCGAFCMPEGERWMPARQPTQVEIPPLLIWQKTDTCWSTDQAKAVRLSRREKDIFASRGRSPTKPPTIFIAYRMQNVESKRFREELEIAINAYPDLLQFKVKDGRVPIGTKWADKIRELIRSSKVVIGDVTGMRPDVLFELGFAFGLGKVVIPVISSTFNIESLPSWLGATQLGRFGDRSGLASILTSISAHLLDPEYSRPPRAPQEIPGFAAWIRSLEWNRHALEVFKTTANREDLKFEVKGESNPDESIIRRAASANLLVVSMDGADGDALMHYLCGAVLSKPTAGYGKRKLPRRILIIQKPGDCTYVADSLRRCQDTVRIVTEDLLKNEIEAFSKTYRQWMNDPVKKSA